jgi:hypothetical protein
LFAPGLALNITLAVLNAVTAFHLYRSDVSSSLAKMDVKVELMWKEYVAMRERRSNQ